MNQDLQSQAAPTSHPSPLAGGLDKKATKASQHASDQFSPKMISKNFPSAGRYKRNSLGAHFSTRKSPVNMPAIFSNQTIQFQTTDMSMTGDQFHVRRKTMNNLNVDQQMAAY